MATLPRETWDIDATSVSVAVGGGPASGVVLDPRAVASVWQSKNGKITGLDGNVPLTAHAKTERAPPQTRANS